MITGLIKKFRFALRPPRVYEIVLYNRNFSFSIHLDLVEKVVNLLSNHFFFI